MDRIEELENRIKDAKDAYYNLSPIISDQEYDALVDELKLLSPNNEQVISVGAPVPKGSTWDKVKHVIPMGSLNKANSFEELNNWINGTNFSDFHITHKIDGSSMELVYENGKLIRCVTRGDGIVGEDVTDNVKFIPSIPKSISIDNITIRGEIVILKKVFEEKYSKEYANPRNFAAAKVREKKDAGKACRDLTFVAYWMESHPSRPQTMDEMFRFLEKLGFKTPLNPSPTESNGLKKVFDETNNARESIEYEIDGMVISVNNIESMEGLGSKSMRPEGQIAWKFDPAMAESRMKEIKWQVGPTGRITPVAVIEPVKIGGVTVTNVSLHNMDMFRELNLFRNCRVLIARKNDVIPYVEENLGEL